MSTRETPRAVLVLLLGVVSAWILFDGLVLLFGESPSRLLAIWLEGTLGSGYGLGQVLFKATPLLFTGIAVDVALRARMFNIGAEGQLMVASLAVAWAGAKLPAGLPAPLAVVSLTLVAAASGALWAGVPALLKVRFGAHEVISTIMMNRIADALVVYGVATMGGGQAVRTADVVPGARLTRLEAWFPALKGSAASVALLFGVLCVVLVAGAYSRTRAGKELVWIGQNARACAAEGIAVRTRIVQAFLLSGALAGAASLATVLGYKGYFEQGLGAGAGFGGLGVALLGRGSALGMVAAALAFGWLLQGGFAINAYVPKEAMDVIQGVVLCAVALADSRVRAHFERHAT